MTEIKFIELFAGMGGVRYGLEKVGIQGQQNSDQGIASTLVGDENGQPPSGNGAESSFSCVWANELDRYASAIYRCHWNDGTLCEGDIGATDADTIPEHDLLTAGFPCQDFSIAGKRAGLEGIRGTLFYEICRVLRAKRPGYLLLENVRGLLSADDREAFFTILRCLDDLGYDCQWQVLNSKDFGVPQNRERVFIIGHTRGQPRPKVFPVGEANQLYSEAHRGERQEVSPSIRAHETGGQGDIEMPLVAICIDANYGKGWLDHGQRTMIQTGYLGHNRMAERVYSPDGLAVAIRSEGGGWGGKPGGLYDVYNRNFRANQNLAGALKGEGISDTSIGTALIYHENISGKRTPHKEAQALRSGASHNYQTVNRIRRLTPIECERLQGFPDNWTKYGLTKEGKQIEISDTQRYKCCGNAVTTNVITAIGTRMLEESSGHG